MFIIDLFEAAVAQSPSATALLLEDSRYVTYAHLNEAANGLSVVITHYLSRSHEKEEEVRVTTPLVALLMTRDVAAVTAMLAVGKSQAAYVPVDPAFPPDRQSHIFLHSQCQLLIADSESYSTASSLGVVFPPTLVVEASTGKVLQWPDGSVAPPSELSYPPIYSPSSRKHDPEALMYVLYTSGSTGKPKGVMVKQVGVTNTVRWFANELGVSNRSRVMCLTTFCFDISVLELYLPLICGGISVLAKSSSQKNPFALLDLVKSSECTVFQATPTTYEMMFATGWNGDPSIDFLVGGEAFRPSLLPLAGNCRSLRNVYGPTETTIWSSSFTVPKSFSVISPGTTPPSIPIGAVISQTTFYLVEEGKQPWTQVTGKDAEGELWIGGIGVARGYLHAPDLTEKVFLSNPFDASLGFVYRTGDIVKKLDDGSDAYVFVRRMDDQVKIDGFRIELQEIEAVYMQHKSVEKAVALVRGGNKLIVYIKPNPSNRRLSESQVDELTSFVSRSLTYYMVPKFTVQVETFPQTANGKLDRKSLPDPPEWSSSDDNKAKLIDSDKDVTSIPEKIPSIDPSNTMATQSEASIAMISVEDIICEIIQNLRGQRPKLNSSFSSLGVDSLGAVFFVRFLSDRLGGLSIDPGKLYAPGFTVKAAAEFFYDKLKNEFPERLVKLNIKAALRQTLTNNIKAKTLLSDSHSPGDEEIGEFESVLQDVDNNCNDDDDDNNNSIEAAHDESFNDKAISNRRLIEGLRGVFAFMVLFEHFTYDWYSTRGTNVTLAFMVDTEMFMLISGFTTALQLRQCLRYNKKTLKIVPPKPFLWKSFIASRMIGIFPIFWFALLISVPRWNFTNLRVDAMHKNESNIVTDPTASRVCSAMYVIAMQQWWCSMTASGPKETWYASDIFNCFLFYSLLRYIICKVQHYWLWSDKNTPLNLKDVMPSLYENLSNTDIERRDGYLSNKSPHSPTRPITAPHRNDKFMNLEASPTGAFNKEKSGDVGKQQPPSQVESSLLLYIRIKWAQLSLNCPEYGFGALCTLLLMWFIGAFYLLSQKYDKEQRNALSFYPYFFSGACTANVCEWWHCHIWKWQQKCDEKRQLSSQRDHIKLTALEGNEKVEIKDEELRSQSINLRGMEDAAGSESSNIDNETMSIAPNKGSTIPAKTSSRNARVEMLEQKLHSYFIYCKYHIQEFCRIEASMSTFIRIFVDALGAFFGLLCSPGTKLIPLKYSRYEMNMKFILMPFLGAAYLSLAFMFTKETKYCISRLFLESTPTNIMGYCSFALYLLQYIIVTFYGGIIAKHVLFPGSEPFNTNPSDGPKYFNQYNDFYYDHEWFRYQPVSRKVGGCLVLVAFCYLVQYSVDFIVAWLYGKYINMSIKKWQERFFSSKWCTFSCRF